MHIFITGPQEAGEEAPPDDEEAREDGNVRRGSCRIPPDQLDYDEKAVHARPVTHPACSILPARWVFWKPPFSAPQPPLP